MQNKPEQSRTNLTMSNKLYDILRSLTQYYLPAFAGLYFGLSQVWGFPYGEEVLGTLAAIEVFLGTLLGVSNHQYNKNPSNFDGELNLDMDLNKADLELETSMDDLEDGDKVTFFVHRTN